MQRLLIIGAGFAGMYAAISAARLRHLQGVSADDLEIALISPEPFLVIRPRLYEPKPETMKAPLTELFQEMDVRYVQGSVEEIDSASGLAASSGRKASSRRWPTTDWSWPPAAQVSAPTFQALQQHAFGVD
jgi:NADH dehydrogenase